MSDDDDNQTWQCGCGYLHIDLPRGIGCAKCGDKLPDLPKVEPVKDAVAYIVRVPVEHDLDYTNEVVVGIARATGRQVIIARGDVELHDLDLEMLKMIRDACEEAITQAIDGELPW